LAIEIISSRSDIYLMSSRLGAIGLFSWGFAWIPGLLFGVASIGLIKHQEGRLTGKKYANTGLLISTVWVIFIFGCFGRGPAEKARIRLAKRICCAANLHGLGIALQIYADDYDDQYPTAEKWCDLLIAYIEVSPKQLVCKDSDAKIGESSYAFNKNLIGKRPTEVPPDVVVLFETNFGKNPVGRQALLAERDWHKFLDYPDSEEKVYKLCWNQVGGPELVTFENHGGKGCNILFNDLHIEFVRTERLGELKWEAEDGKNRPAELDGNSVK